MAQCLVLNECEIDDPGIEALVDGLVRCRHLRRLHLCEHPSITARGWRVLSTLLENQNLALRLLSIARNDIDDESAISFANVLSRNNTLETLYLDSSGITSEGWDAFAKVLCDTSSVNSTYLSNHTLHTLTEMRNFSAWWEPLHPLHWRVT